MMDLRLVLISATSAIILVACAGGPGARPVTADGGATNGTLLLRPVSNPELALDTSGTVGPMYSDNSLDRGFGAYDGDLQSSWYLCAGTGPVAGPCLAVMGGLIALAGATTSLIYSVQQGAEGRSATTTTRAALADNPQLPQLSSRIATRTVELAASAATPLLLASGPHDSDCAAASSEEIPRGVAALDIADLKVEFEPGYQFKLTIVARVRTQFCGGDQRRVERRLAYLGPATSMSKDPARARVALDRAIETAVATLASDVHVYAQNYLVSVH